MNPDSIFYPYEYYDEEIEEDEIEIETDLTEWIDTEDSGETLETILQRKTKFQPGNVIEPINGGRSVTIKKVLMYSERTYSYLVESPVFGEQVLMQSIESKFRRIK